MSTEARYWRYEDRVTRTAKIHHAGCGDCNHGAGHSSGAGPAPGWQPFSSYEEALSAPLDHPYTQPPVGCRKCSGYELMA